MNRRLLFGIVLISLCSLLAGCSTTETQEFVKIIRPIIEPHPSPPSPPDVLGPVVDILVKVHAKQIEDKARVEEEMRSKGETITQPVVRIEDLKVNPNSVVAGDNIIATCRYAAYGPADDKVVPSGTLRLLRNGSEARRYPLDIKGTGRSEFTPQNIILAEDAASGEWQIEVNITYGTASDTRQCTFQITDAPESRAVSKNLSSP